MTDNRRQSLRQNWHPHLLPLAVLALILLVSIIVRIRLLDAPLERDEGEHGYLAQTMLAGYPPWQVAYNLKLPGTDAFYAIFLALFGQTATAIRVGLLLINTATILLIAYLGKRLFGIAGGAVAGASYALLSCSQGVVGTIAHSTHFVAFFAVIATILLLRAGDSVLLLFLSGLTFGIAFLMKQPGMAFGVFGAIYVAWQWRQNRTPFVSGAKGLAAYVIGLASPYALLCLALWKAGTFPRFWFWTVTLAQAYAAKVSLSHALQNFNLQFPRVVDANVLLWLLAGIGLVLASSNPATRRAGLFTAALLLFSLLAVAAGGVFNPHYFILMLPAVALANGALVAAGKSVGAKGDRPEFRKSGEIHSSHLFARQRIAESAAIICFAAACICSIILQRAYLFRMNAYDFERSSYGLNPFPEAVKVAEYIKSHSDPDAKIAVVGSEAEIYFYSHRRAATGYLFTYGLMETHQYALRGQLEMIHEIESAKPEYIVFVGVGSSWLATRESAREIFRWMHNYTDQFYETAGAVNLEPGEESRYAWGADAYVYKAASSAYMTVYRRRQNALARSARPVTMIASERRSSPALP